VHVAFLAATTVHEYALLDAGKICGSWEVRGNGACLSLIVYWVFVKDRGPSAIWLDPIT
jgi:hypothetical protein